MGGGGSLKRFLPKELGHRSNTTYHIFSRSPSQPGVAGRGKGTAKHTNSAIPTESSLPHLQHTARPGHITRFSMTPCSPSSWDQCRISITVPHCPAVLSLGETRCILQYTLFMHVHCSALWHPSWGQLSRGLPSVVQALCMYKWSWGGQKTAVVGGSHRPSLDTRGSVCVLHCLAHTHWHPAVAVPFPNSRTCT